MVTRAANDLNVCSRRSNKSAYAMAAPVAKLFYVAFLPPARGRKQARHIINEDDMHTANHKIIIEK
jgi:hypothetical protein